MAARTSVVLTPSRGAAGIGSKPPRPKNHPQQVAVLGVDDDRDTRHTPDTLYRPLAERWGFTLDAAANSENAKCERFFDLETNGLVQSWAGERVWCNPPFSDLDGWTSKARHETDFGGCPLVVMLLPANRTEQPFWQDMIEPVRDKRDGRVWTSFVRGRLNFETSERSPESYTGSPPFGLVLVTFEGSGVVPLVAPPLPRVCLRPPRVSRQVPLFGGDP